VKSQLHVGDIVEVHQGRYVARALVIETYQSPTGERAVVQVPAEPGPDDESSTFNYKVDDLHASLPRERTRQIWNQRGRVFK